LSDLVIADLVIEKLQVHGKNVALMQIQSEDHFDSKLHSVAQLGGGASSNSALLRARTKSFPIRIVKLFKALPHQQVAYVLGKQLLRSGTSVAANYRAVCRARSRAEFVAKMGVVVEETDETLFWLEMMVETDMLRPERLKPLMTEATELLRIFSASRKTAAGK
jgi:four helix bundle protein